MEISEKLDVFFSEEHIFNSPVLRLRSLILESGLEETYKWSFPTYTLDNKNVVAIGKFKNHFALWFFNGGLLKDPYNVLGNVQEGKTKAMRHWKFNSADEIDAEKIKEYIDAAIANQKKGIEITPIKKKQTAELILPELLQKELNKNPEAKKAFDALSQAKQRDYALYINEAKMEKTKISRLAKIIPMISVGKGLNDQYR